MSLVIEDAYLPATLTASLMTDEEFVEFCARYPDYFIEMSAEGDILIVPFSGWLTSAQINKISQQLNNWSDEVDPEHRAVEIYKPGREPETLVNVETVAGEGPSDGFVLDLRPVWNL